MNVNAWLECLERHLNTASSPWVEHEQATLLHGAWRSHCPGAMWGRALQKTVAQEAGGPLPQPLQRTSVSGSSSVKGSSVSTIMRVLHAVVALFKILFDSRSVVTAQPSHPPLREAWVVPTK